MVQNPPKKHHYIPRFYLKRWALTGGELAEYSRPSPRNNLVKTYMKHPAGTAWKEGGYDFEGVPEPNRSHLEKVVFHFVDSKAAHALDLIERDAPGSEWTNEYRQAWVMFLMSLFTRHPVDIEAFKQVYVRDWPKSAENYQEQYEAARAAGDPDTVTEYFKQTNPTFLRDMALNTFTKLMNYERGVTELMNMKWFVAAPHKDGYFFTSDRPLIRTQLGTDRAYWMLPIGPRKLFIATPRDDVAQAITRRVEGNDWKEINRAVVRHAVKFGYSTGEQHVPFFQKHLAMATQPSVFWSFVADPKKVP